MGVKITRIVKYIRKGDKGEQGPTLRGPQAWSDCAVGYPFQAGGNGDEWKDVTIYGTEYYSCVKNHTKTANNYPGSAEDRNNNLWRLADRIELVATKILLATYALVKNLGVEAIDMKDSAGNILFRAKDGVVTCKTGNFDNVNINSGKIAGFKVSGNGLTNDPFTNDAYIIFRNDAHNCFAGIGGNVLPTSSGLRAVARFENEDTADWWGLGANYAMLVSARGALNNIAISMAGGCISGLAVKCETVSATKTLSRGVVSVACINKEEITITLPTMQLYDDGYVIKIKNLNEAKVNIKPGYSYHGTPQSQSYKQSYIHADRGAHFTNASPYYLQASGDATELVYHRDLTNETQYGCWVQYKNPRDW